MQPDLGMTMIWGPVLLALLFVAGIPVRYLICIVLDRGRVHAARDQSRAEAVSERAHHRVHQSRHRSAGLRLGDQPIADCDRLRRLVGGKGFKAPNTQIELGFLPATAVHNDYIFSAIGEQWGFRRRRVSCSAHLALLLLTCLFVALCARRSIRAAARGRDELRSFSRTSSKTSA
ncbi:MAG: hypothetical protein WKF47_06470 [Geodermatophilaceae bacterium]